MTLAELLASVRRVEVKTNRLVNDTMVGAYLSHFKGRGMDFEELREYMPGDEVRDIDWNVTYRMGRPFVSLIPSGWPPEINSRPLVIHPPITLLIRGPAPLANGFPLPIGNS